MAVSPDGKYLATGSLDKIVRLYDIQTGAVIRSFSGHTDQIYSVAFSPDGQSVLTGNLDRTARLWNTNSGQLVRTFIGHVDASGWQRFHRMEKLF